MYGKVFLFRNSKVLFLCQTTMIGGLWLTIVSQKDTTICPCLTIICWEAQNESNKIRPSLWGVLGEDFGVLHARGISWFSKIPFDIVFLIRLDTRLFLKRGSHVFEVFLNINFKKTHCQCVFQQEICLKKSSSSPTRLRSSSISHWFWRLHSSANGTFHPLCKFPWCNIQQLGMSACDSSNWKSQGLLIEISW